MIKGGKYSSDLDIVQIGKLFREDVKIAKKNDLLPKDLKISVRVKRYSGGRSIYVSWYSPSLQLNIYTYQGYNEQSFISVADTFIRGNNPQPLLTEYQNTLNSLLGAYNFDDSDANTDYFHVNFYGKVNFDKSLLQPSNFYEALGEELAKTWLALAPRNSDGGVILDDPSILENARGHLLTLI